MKLRVIAELFGKQHEHQWVVPNVARFVIAGGEYTVQFYQHTGNGIVVTEVVFSLEQGLQHSTAITGSGNAGAVLGMVLAIIGEYVQQHQPHFLFFTAKEPSRQRLYATMVRKLAREWFVVVSGAGTMLVSRQAARDQATAQQLAAKALEDLG